MGGFTELRYSTYDLIRFLLICGSAMGAFILFGLLIWARTRFGWGWAQSREIMAIVIDVAMLLCLATVVIVFLSLLRTLGVYSSDEALRRAGMGNLISIFVIFWLSIARWLLWALPLRGRNPVR